MNVWRMLFADVHRPFFLGGIIYALVALGLWTLHLMGYLPYELPIAQVHIHMAQMIYFFFPFYFFGFLLTIFPRQMSTPAVPRRAYISMFLCYFMGATIFTIGLYMGEAWTRTGAILAMTGFGLGAYQLLRVLLLSQHPHKLVPVFMWIGIAFGFMGLLSLVCFSFSAAEIWIRISKAIGLYGFLLPVVYSVTYRMVPMFTAVNGREVTRDRYGLQLMLAFSMMRLILTVWDLHEFYWLADTGLLCIITHQLWQWRIWRRKPYVIQSILHWALTWFPLAFLLAAVTSFVSWLTGERWLIIEQAALHALVVGGFGTLLLGMATRVTLGHAGLPVVTDSYTNTLFYAFQLVPVMRVGSGLLSEIWPQIAEAGIYASGFAWVAFFALWAWRYLPIYVLPRASGRSG